VAGVNAAIMDIEAKPRMRGSRKCKFLEITRCTGSHPQWLCKDFRDKTPEKRSRITKDNKLCPFCLLHSAEEICYSGMYKTKPVCPIPECKKLHIEWLHHVMHRLRARRRNVSTVRECKGWRTPEDLWMDLEAAFKEAFFVNMLVGEEEEMEDLKFIKRREEEESARLERGVDNRVERTAMKKHTKEDESEQISELGNSPGCAGGRSWTWTWMR
jgi:hypothetical protein